MQINIDKAFQYYIENYEKACNKSFTLNKKQFSKFFIDWLNTINMQDPDLDHIPIINNCGQSRWVNIESVLNKVK